MLISGFLLFLYKKPNSLFNQKMNLPLFLPNALLMGAETRTSAPLRITRSKKFESVNIRNLCPIGEGAGYTGGITRSAADAIRAMETVMG
jgi:uncharacterized protein